MHALSSHAKNPGCNSTGIQVKTTASKSKAMPQWCNKTLNIVVDLLVEKGVEEVAFYKFARLSQFPLLQKLKIQIYDLKITRKSHIVMSNSICLQWSLEKENIGAYIAEGIEYLII